MISLILASFMMFAFFSFAVMMHGPEGGMQGNCPFSAIGVTLCPQDTFAVAVHHISAYQSFFNISANSGITTLILSLLLMALVFFTFSISPPLFKPLALIGSSYNPPPITPYDRKIRRWLSILENSPSLH